MFHWLFKSLRRSRFTQTDKLFTQFQHQPKTTIVCLIFVSTISLFSGFLIVFSAQWHMSKQHEQQSVHCTMKSQLDEQENFNFFSHSGELSSLPQKQLSVKKIYVYAHFFASVRYISNSSCFWYHFIFKHPFYLNLIFVCSFYVYDFFLQSAKMYIWWHKEWLQPIF